MALKEDIKNLWLKEYKMLLRKATKEELAGQIERRLAYTDKDTMIKLLITLENGFDSRKLSPFDLLPNEIVMKIIRMMLAGCGNQRHNCLVHTMAMISARDTIQ